MNGLAEQLLIPEKHWQEIVRHIQNCFPEEGCGLAGGVIQDGIARVEGIFPVTNLLHSPVRFHMEPAGQLKAFTALDERGLDLVAIFHSHPSGPETPSPTDLAEFYYPGVLTLIISPQRDQSGWRARAFHLNDSQSGEVPVTCIIKNT